MTSSPNYSRWSFPPQKTLQFPSKSVARKKRFFESRTLAPKLGSATRSWGGEVEGTTAGKKKVFDKIAELLPSVLRKLPIFSMDKYDYSNKTKKKFRGCLLRSLVSTNRNLLRTYRRSTKKFLRSPFLSIYWRDVSNSASKANSWNSLDWSNRIRGFLIGH